jgi:hypothetical protein
MNKKAGPLLLAATLSAVLMAVAHAATPAQTQAPASKPQVQQVADADDAAPASKQAAVVAAASDAKEEVICKRIKATGTRMGARVCRTEEEWELVEYGARETMRAIEGTSMPRDANTIAPQPNIDN